MKFFSTIWRNYYWYILLFYCISTYSFSVRIGVLASIVMLITYLSSLLKSFKLNIFDYLVNFYFCWNFLSIFFFLFNDLPLSVYVREFSNSVLPIGFYYLGKVFIHERLNFYYNSSLSFLAILILGLLFFIYQPDFYRVYLDNLEGIGMNIISSSSEFRSLVGLTMTGSLSFVLVAYSASRIIESQNIIWKLVLLFAVVCGFITFRRSAMVLILFELGFFMLFMLKISRVFFFNFITATGFLLFLFFVYFISYLDFNLLGSLFFDRLNMLSEGIDERKDSWYSSFKVANWILGDGLGVYGHKAVEFSDIYIPDGYYFRLIAELGIPGFLAFLAIIICSLIKSFSKLRVYFYEFSIIFGLSIQAIGSDIFSFQLVAPLFWYCTGVILGASYCNVNSHERD